MIQIHLNDDGSGEIDDGSVENDDGSVAFWAKPMSWVDHCA